MSMAGETGEIPEPRHRRLKVLGLVALSAVLLGAIVYGGTRGKDNPEPDPTTSGLSIDAFVARIEQQPPYRDNVGRIVTVTRVDNGGSYGLPVLELDVGSCDPQFTVQESDSLPNRLILEPKEASVSSSTSHTLNTQPQNEITDRQGMLAFALRGDC